jgi:DNA repair protein RadD
MNASLSRQPSPSRVRFACTKRRRSSLSGIPFVQVIAAPVLQLPTGAGKTRIAAEIINGALAKERRAIFVVPRISLIEQTVAPFEREGIWNVGVIQGQHFRTNLNAPVQIASAQTLARREIPPADIVIVDECHLQFKSITEWIAEPEWQAVPFIGLSATPWAKGLGKSYDDLLMPVSIQELIGEGYLSSFRVFAPPAPDLTAVRTVAGDFRIISPARTAIQLT